jgi:hypothetical protein
MIKDLLEILSWQRGAGTKSEQQFVDLHIASIPNIEKDDYGNYHLMIGDQPNVMWSCHTDTVTRREGRQNVKWMSKGLLGLQNGKAGQCLGADDGGGIWLMKEMIKAGKEGYYVFHRDEECGGLGSSWLSKNAFYFPDTLTMAIAMDRAGTQDVITHQGFERCCSDEFARSLAAQLGKGWVPDDSGVFTDTANYTSLIPECTNLSIGYEHNHGPRETLNTDHLQRLRDSLLALKVSDLVVKRDPTVNEYADGMAGYARYLDDDFWENDPNRFPALTVVKQKEDFADIVRKHPGVAARLLEELGVEFAEFRAHVFAFTGQVYDDN